MGPSSIGPLRFLPVLLILSKCQRVEWDAANFPNPTAGDFKRCNMRTTANICDPDGVLTESQRYRLNHELHQLESRTRQDNAPDFCQKKGVTAAMAIVKHVRGASEAAVKEMANEILRKWSLDDQCQKSVVFVVATEDRRFWVARDPRVPVYAQEFTQIFADQKQLFQQGNYPQALGNILQQTWNKALSKQGAGGGAAPPGGRSGPDRGGLGPAVGPPPVDVGPQPDGKKGGKLLPHIPFWVWLAVILLVIPLLCCCCLCYCCFCRKGASSSPRRQGPSDVEGSGGVPIGGAGDGGRPAAGRGGGMNSFLGGLGGAGLGHLAGRLMGGGGGGGGGLSGLFGGGARSRGAAAGSGYQGGGAYPAAPFQPTPKGEDYGGGRAGGGSTATGGKGLYPSAAIRDEGGGGGW